MITRFTGFIGPSYTSQSVNVDCQRTVNLFPEVNPLGTGKEKEVASLVPSPGLKLLLTLPQSPLRGLWRGSNELLYAVAGNALYLVSSTFTYTALGTLLTATGPVSMADNGLQLVVVDGPNGYQLTLSNNTFAQILDANFFGANQVAFQDGYFIFNKPGADVFYISPLNAVTPFSALQSAVSEGSPDNVVGLIDNLQSLFVFNTQTIEVFYDSGDTFPFSRIQGALIAVGCVGAFTIQKLSNVIYWLGQDESGFGIVYRAQSYQPERISTPAIEAVIRSLGSTAAAAARAWSYQQGGHQFYCLNIPGSSATWVYDASTGLWHERTYLALWGQERHRAECHATAYGMNIVGDYQNGNLYQLDPDTLTDNGTSISRERVAPHISENMTRHFHHEFQLDMEVGVGTVTGQGQDPQVVMRYSDDGGHTWSSERFASIGAIGNTKTRITWRRLGQSRDRVYHVKITDPVKTVLIGAQLDVEAAAS